MANFKVPGEHIYNGMVMAGIFPAQVLDRVPDFEFRSDDILIVTYPKSGTTWLQHITWLIVNGVDVETSRRVPIYERSPLIQKSRDMSILPMLKSPRIIKNHLPYSFFKKAIEGEGKPRFKVVVVMRNVKDVLVSYYNFYRMSTNFGNFNQSFDAFFNLFKDRKLVGGDYFDHVLSWWKERQNPDLYFIKYEDMKEDPKSEIVKLASFLGKTLRESEIGQIIAESSFESMQKNPMTNMSLKPLYDFDISEIIPKGEVGSCTNMAVVPEFNLNISKFIRKGEVGDWKNYFTEEQQQYIDSRIHKELISNGLRFKYI